MNDCTLIGLMSGSSLDGLDIVCVRFWFEEKKINWEIKGKPKTIPYPSKIQSLLKEVHTLDELSLTRLDDELGYFYGTATKQYILDYNLAPSYIASHGHTVRHHPEEGYTLQIGNGQKMANASGLSCITQFRSEDIAQGGQGAPLAPVVEQYLFSEHQMFLNIGGIANIAVHTENKIIAYDICPANQLLNFLAGLVGKAYDKNGDIAKIGRSDESLIQKLMQDPFLSMDYPKSLDNNYIRDFYFGILEKSKAAPSDLLASCTIFVAKTIAKEIKSLAKQHQVNDVLITGGGAYNGYLIGMIKAEVGDVNVTLPEAKIIEQKESILMALCGYLFLENIPNSFASATGATKDTVNGILHYPKL